MPGEGGPEAGRSGRTGDGDAVLAWRVLRRVGGYVEAWELHGAAGAARALEPGPFPIRVQAEADMEAARFELLAWEDPHDADGPASPFWRQDGMPEGVLDPEAPPLAAIAGEGASVEGLRLLCGDLVVRIEWRGAALQVRLRDAARFPDDGGICIGHAFGLRMPHAMRRMVDFWNAAGRQGPRTGRARRDGRTGSSGCWR